MRGCFAPGDGFSHTSVCCAANGTLRCAPHGKEETESGKDAERDRNSQQHEREGATKVDHDVCDDHVARERSTHKINRGLSIDFGLPAAWTTTKAAIHNHFSKHAAAAAAADSLADSKVEPDVFGAEGDSCPPTGPTFSECFHSGVKTSVSAPTSTVYEYMLS